MAEFAIIEGMILTWPRIHFNSASLSKAILEKRMTEKEVQDWVNWHEPLIPWFDYWKTLTQEEKVKEAQRWEKDAEAYYYQKKRREELRKEENLRKEEECQRKQLLKEKRWREEELLKEEEEHREELRKEEARVENLLKEKEENKRRLEQLHKEEEDLLRDELLFEQLYIEEILTQESDED